MMRISQMTQKMIAFYGGNIDDINHFMKVWGFAKTIGELEALDESAQFILEAAAITHDIACPLCREKHGNANGKLQEKEGPPLVYDFFRGTDLTEEQIERIAFLVGHHHTYAPIDGLDHQILIEADYLVNAGERRDSLDKVRNMYDRFFKTKSGKDLLKTIYFL